MPQPERGSLLYMLLQAEVTMLSQSGVSGFPLKMLPRDSTFLVIEECGAMPDLEDREGEVSFFFVVFVIRTSKHRNRRPSIKLL